MTEKSKINKFKSTYHINLKDAENALETVKCMRACTFKRFSSEYPVFYNMITVRSICFFMSIDFVSFAVFSSIFRPPQDDYKMECNTVLTKYSSIQDLGFRSFLQRTSPAMLSPHRTSPAMLSFQNTSPAMLSPLQQVIISNRIPILFRFRWFWFRLLS